MGQISSPQDGDRLSAAYLRYMILDPTSDEFRRLRQLLLPAGLFRRLGSGRTNQGAVAITGVVSRAPLTVRVDCPATSGLTTDGDYLECEPFACDVVLPSRGAFDLHLVRVPGQLPEAPVKPPVRLDEKFALATRGGLLVAHGTVGTDLTPALDEKWIVPAATLGGSKKVCDAVASLRERLEQLDLTVLASATTDRARTLLARWTAFYAPWRALNDATALDEYLVHTSRFFAQMWSDTRAVFGTADRDALAGEVDSLAAAFRRLAATAEALAAAWEPLLRVPLTTAIPLAGEPAQRPSGNHTEIVIRTLRRPIPCESVVFQARAAGPFRPEVTPVIIDLSASHTTRVPRAWLTAPVPGTVGCRIVLTPEERAEGRIRLFVHRDLTLSSITIAGD